MWLRGDRGEVARIELVHIGLDFSLKYRWRCSIYGIQLSERV